MKDETNIRRKLSALARILLCHRDGKVVPMRWQSCASSMAQLCHRSGTNLSLHTAVACTSNLSRKLFNNKSSLLKENMYFGTGYENGYIKICIYLQDKNKQ